MWKNGQCVTINKKKYRVKTVINSHYSCDYCSLQYHSRPLCESLCLSIGRKLGRSEYLEEIPAKGKVLAK